MALRRHTREPRGDRHPHEPPDRWLPVRHGGCERLREAILPRSRSFSHRAAGAALSSVLGGTLDFVPANRVYSPEDRPEVEVQLEDGRWVEGELRAWQARGDEQWASVAWSDAGETWLGTIPADRVRKLELTDQLRAVLAFSQRTFPDEQARDAAIHTELQMSPVRYAHQLAWLEQQAATSLPEVASMND